jgi:L-fuconolactonase
MENVIIDAHQHFWKFDPGRDTWITEPMHVLRKDYLPDDLGIVFRQNKIHGSIVVQANSSVNENRFLLDLAGKHPFILGVVGWVDLTSEDLEEQMKYYKQFPLLKGFRHLLQGEEQRDMMLNFEFQRGISLLEKYGFSFDLLILPDQLGFAERLVAAFPDQRFVIDHLAKPQIKHGIISEWRIALKKFASFQNVYCKISGMVTEADTEFWENEDFRPYIDTVLDVFGTRRIMFGSDWPVCLQAGKYEEVKNITDNYFSSFSISEQSDFLGNNAIEFYRLN